MGLFTGMGTTDGSRWRLPPCPEPLNVPLPWLLHKNRPTARAFSRRPLLNFQSCVLWMTRSVVGGKLYPLLAFSLSLPRQVCPCHPPLFRSPQRCGRQATPKAMPKHRICTYSIDADDLPERLSRVWPVKRKLPPTAFVPPLCFAFKVRADYG